jgi:CheY-like chemotaxis protein
MGARTPVLLMSGFADEELIRDLPASVAQVLAKPFPSAELLRAMREALADPRDAVAGEGLPEAGGPG